MRDAGYAALAALVLALLLALPLATHPRATVWGEPGDPYGTLAGIDALVHAMRGEPHLPFASLPQPLVDLPAALLALVLGPVLAYNVVLLGALPLAAGCAALAAAELTPRRGARILAALLFAFAPFTLAHARGHLDQAQTWPAALVAWRALVLVRRPTARSALALAASHLAAPLANAYLMLVLAPLTLVAVAVTRARLGVRLVAILALALGSAVTLVAGSRWLGPGDAMARDAGAVGRYAARPIEYLRPSPFHPVWGGIAGSGFARSAHGSSAGEQTLTPGLVAALLALLGLVHLARGAGEPRRLACLLALSGAVCLLASLDAPFGLGRAIPAALPWLRAPARFALGVETAIALLAAVGAGRLGPRILCVVALVAVFEGLHVPVAFPVEPIEATRLLDARAQGVADFPVEPSRYLRLFRPLERAPVIARERLIATFSHELGDPATPGRLRALGVTHVVVHGAAAAVAEAASSAPVWGDGLEVVLQLRGATILAVTADPAPVLLVAHPGLEPPEPGGRWLRGGSAFLVIEATAPVARVEGVLHFTALSRAVARTLTLTWPGGERTLGLLADRPSLGSVPLLFEGPALAVQLRAHPPGAALPGSGDSRPLAVLVAGLRFEVSAEWSGPGRVAPGAGFFAREGDGRRWLGEQATLAIAADGAATLRAQAIALGRPRRLRVRDARAGALASGAWEFDVPSDRWVDIAVDVAAGPTALVLSAPPAVVVADELGGADGRAVTVALRRIRLVDWARPDG